MIAGADQIDLLLLEDIESVAAFWIRAIVQAIAFDSIASVYEDEVDTFPVCP